MIRGDLAVISGRSNRILSEKIATHCGVELTPCDIRCFSDGEISVEIGANVRGRDVFVVQSTSSPVNDHLMELLMIIDALKRASADRITAVIPYYGYARQDRKSKPRVPITAKLVADLIVSSGAHRVLTMDLHCDQIMGFFNIPVDNLYARPVLMKRFEKIFGKEGVCVVSPDSGGTARARAYAKHVDANLAVIDKRRSAPGEVAEMNVIGDVKGKIAILIDDLIDTGGTLIKASEALLENGAKEVYACSTHAVFSGTAREKFSNSLIKKVVVTDSIYHEDLVETIVDNLSMENVKIKSPHGAPRLYKDWLEMLSVSSLIGEAVTRIHRDSSISVLFETP